MVDFSNLTRPPSNGRPIDPEKIFRSLPNLPETHNDLWGGQITALREWHEHRGKTDTSISLNTGAGKTVVGLLIAQSLVNEGIENVLYLCTTNDLVQQTSREAKKLGFDIPVESQAITTTIYFRPGKHFA